MSRILIAEDEPRLATFVRKGLVQNGFSVTIAEDGQQALEMAITGEFELLLLDLGLPIKDGKTVLRELREQRDTLPIIIVTAFADDQSRTEVIALGANDYLTKPFRFSDLLAKIQANLDQGG
jgi:two-component system, OmpR family, copper resistance phosphate regulon response regulator CusR